MKNLNTNSNTQRGFFDLGLAIAFLASSGVAAYTLAPDAEQDVALQQPSIQAVATTDSKTTETENDEVNGNN